MKNWLITLVFALILFGIGYSLTKIQPAAEPDFLSISLSNPLQKPVPFPESLTIKVKNKAEIKELYADLLAMPDTPKGTTSCPNNNGVSYHLTFMQGNRIILHADAEGTGCRYIGLSNGKVLWSLWKTGDQFWSLFSQTLGLTDKQLRGVTD